MTIKKAFIFNIYKSSNLLLGRLLVLMQGVIGQKVWMVLRGSEVNFDPQRKIGTVLASVKMVLKVVCKEKSVDLSRDSGS